MPVGYLAGMFNAQGPNANCLTACAASSQAVGEATEIIRRGDYNAETASNALKNILGEPGYSENARRLKQIVDSENGTAIACDAIEEVLR